MMATVPLSLPDALPAVGATTTKFESVACRCDRMTFRRRADMSSMLVKDEHCTAGLSDGARACYSSTLAALLPSRMISKAVEQQKSTIGSLKINSLFNVTLDMAAIA